MTLVIIIVTSYNTPVDRLLLAEEKMRFIFTILNNRCSIPLSNLDREITHQNWYELEDGAGKIFLLISISGTLSSDTVCDISSAEANPIDRQAIYERYVKRYLICVVYYNWTVFLNIFAEIIEQFRKFTRYRSYDR